MSLASSNSPAVPDFVRVQIQQGGELADRLDSLRNRMQDHFDRLGCPPSTMPGGTTLSPSPALPKEPTLADVGYRISHAVDALFEQMNRLQST